MTHRFIPPGIWKSCETEGGAIYVIPGAPDKGVGRFKAMRDIIEDTNAFMSRAPGELMLSSADAMHMLAGNVHANRRLGPMDDWRKLWGKELERVCILVSCGPSLTEKLPEIAELTKDDKYFTLGINRAIKAVDLDYYLVLDRRCQRDWIDRDVSRTTLIAATTAASHITEMFEKRYWGESFLGGVDEGNAPLRTGLCITLCEAMFAAYKLGADAILMYGCDFAMSGKIHQGRYLLEKYYFDLPSYLGLGIRPDALREMQPVPGIGGEMCFINYELWAYACYATAMACMIEESGGVPVKNKTGAGILYWGSE